jgi:hypothetical protein
MIIGALLCVLVLLGLANLVVWNPQGYGVAGIVALLGLLASIFACSGAVFLPPLVITALILLLGTIVCAGRQSKIAHFRVFTLCAGAIGMLSGIGISTPYVQHLHKLREQYPMVSLAPRLAYEADRKQPKPGQTAASANLYAPPPQGSPAWANLAVEERDTGSRLSRRTSALERIHASTVEQFIEAPGFGIGRMSHVSDYWLEKRRKPAGPLTPPPDESSPTTPTGPLLTSSQPFNGAESRLALNDQLTNIHRTGVRDFLNPESLGWVVDRNHVAGFESHHFSNEFQPSFVTHSAESPELELSRLELVSLLKSDRPRVYVSNQNLPQLDQAHEAQTRALNPFETASLALLEKGEDFVFNEHGPHILAFGSLRAGAECLKCHEVQRGALLGAFSYQFHRVLPPQPNKLNTPQRELHGRRVSGEIRSQ